jgi:hypothetical protein
MGKPIHQYHTALDNKLQAQNVYQQVTKLLAKYTTIKPPTQWMEDQTEILDKYITDCILSAEATIHQASLDNSAPKKWKWQQLRNSGNYPYMPTRTNQQYLHHQWLPLWRISDNQFLKHEQ